MIILHDCLPRLIEQYAFDQPETPAALFGSDTLSYSELNSRSNQLARYLEKMGAKPGDIIGLCLPRGIEMIIALLAIIKTGAAYLPLDPDYPKERLQKVIKKAQPKILVTETSIAHRIGTKLPIFCLKTDMVKSNLESTENIIQSIHSDQLCYVIFTSGSTGEPKGVAVTHGNISRIFDDIGKKYHFSSNDVWSQLHSLAFGFSVFEIWGALIHGACIAIAPQTARSDTLVLRKYLKDNNISIMSQTPSVFRETLLTSRFMDKWQALSIRVLFLSGEGIQTEDLLKWSNQIFKFTPKLVNTYAITETGGNVMLREYTSEDLDAKNIGTSLSHAKTYVLDKNQKPVNTGVPGELYVGGSGVAAGYLNDKKLTANYFINLPNIEGRLYRTGDIVQQLPDSSFEFLGRKDNQVKWHGFRVELEELESLLRSHQHIENAAVAIKTDENGRDKLIGYIVPASNSQQTSELWPSLGGYQIYDSFLYDLMSTDKVRNSAFGKAFELCASGKTVLDIGTGPHALLAKLAEKAGAKKVYAVEVLPDMAEKARTSINEHGLADRIDIIEGDASALKLTEPAEICTQGIIGNIGSADGIASIWNSVRSQLKEGYIPIPQRCTTMIAAVELPEELSKTPSFSNLAQKYLAKIFSKEERAFDPRLCIRNLNPDQIISDCHVFEDLDFHNELPLSHKGKGRFTLKRNGQFDGFLVWTVVNVTDSIKLDYLNHQQAWLPVFLPLSVDGQVLPKNTVINAEWDWSTSENSIFPDYRICSTFDFNEKKQHSNYTTRHHETALNSTPIHRKLQEFKQPEPLGLSGKELRNWLGNYLPTSLLPNSWVTLEELPVNFNGKLDRKSLPLPKEPTQIIPKNEIQTALETDLKKIWQDILGLTTFSIKDNFFDLGGDSITSIRLTSRMQQFFDIDIALTAIFDAPTIASLACFIEDNFKLNLDQVIREKNKLKAKKPNKKPSKTAISEEDLLNSLNNQHLIPAKDIDQLLERQRSLIKPWKGHRIPTDSFIFTLNKSGLKQALFWCFQNHTEHQRLAEKLGPNQPLCGMRSGHLLMEYTSEAINILSKYYASEMHQIQPTGDFLIGGNCQGGILAQAIALQLLKLRRKVKLLILMEVSEFTTYPEPVTLLFGHDSKVNPFKKESPSPEESFKKAYTKSYSVQFINGAHGEFFNESNIKSLATVITDQLDHIS